MVYDKKSFKSGGGLILMDNMCAMHVGDEVVVLQPNGAGTEADYAKVWALVQLPPDLRSM